MRRQLWIGGLLGALFLAFALRGIPLAAVVDAFGRMRVVPVVWMTAIFGLQLGLRTTRQLLLVRPLAPGTGLRSELAVLAIGFFFINVLPARLGEVVRPYLWRQREGISMGSGFGVVFVERALDLIGIGTALLLVLLLVDIPGGPVEIGGSSVDLARIGQRLAITLLAPAIVLLVGLAVLGTRAVAFLSRVIDRIERRRGPGGLVSLGRFIVRLADGFGQGLRALREPGRMLAAVALTGANIACMGALTLAAAEAFDLGAWIGFGEAVGVTVITMLGIALPAPPGFAGVFEGSARAGLTVFGVVGSDLDARALAMVLVLHWWLFLVQAALGLACMASEGLRFGDLLAVARESGGAEGDTGPGA